MTTWNPGTAEEEAAELVDIMADWPVGAVAERRLNHVMVRMVMTPPAW
jgi:hypothetical protein